MVKLPDDYECEGQLSIWDLEMDDDWAQYMNAPVDEPRKGEINDRGK